MAQFETLLVHQGMTTENVAKARMLTAVFAAGGFGRRIACRNRPRKFA